jgi:glycosyltransferase involved in cell wall biosynthesis
VYAPNPYLPLLYQALAAHGVTHVPDVALEPGSFAGSTRVADVLHVHWLYPLFRGGRWPWLGSGARIRDGLARLESVRRQGVPLIWTVHNLKPHDGFRRGERAAYAAVHAMADLRVFHSRGALAEARRIVGSVGGETLVMHHGNYAGAFPPPGSRGEVLDREGIPAGRRILLCVGQVRHYKGFDVAARAMRSLEAAEYHLVVAGRPIDGSGSRLRRLARGAGNVTLLLGELTPQRLADLLGAADAVLLPYRAITGSGVLLHALTAEKGVIASDLPYFREVLAGEPGAAVLVRPDDPGALADGIRAFFSAEPGSAAEAAARLGRSFDWGTMAEPLARWIHAAVGSIPLPS